MDGRLGALLDTPNHMNPPTEKFLRAPGIEARAVERTAVLMAPERHIYFAVNRVGTRIWSLLQEPRSVAELVGILTVEFSVEEAECRRHTEEFLRELLGKELVTRVA
jgi:Coenzyme PQQ synthesis protein D (PqqD)